MGAMDERRIRGHGPSPAQVRIAALEKVGEALCQAAAKHLTDCGAEIDNPLWAAIDAWRKVHGP